MPDWALYGVNVESNFDDQLAASAVFSAATPGMLIIPSFSLGAGPTFQLAPPFKPGVRLEASMQFPLLGLVSTLDILPGTRDGDPRALQVGLMGQVSF